jgi:hypothetical protein
MGGVFFFWGWQNFATWWIFFSESEKKGGKFCDAAVHKTI